jgi:two-component system response regulator WspF
MRVAIVNDLRIAVEALRRVVTSDPRHEIAWIALDGNEAIKLCSKDRPDVILMDLIMPGLDGAQTTKQIMSSTPCPILVVTATVSGNYSLVYDALGFGAVDAVNTPSLAPNGKLQGATELLDKIDRIAKSRDQLKFRAPQSSVANISKDTSVGIGLKKSTDLIAIGASTGGPQAIATLLQQISTISSASILIAQHIGSDFIEGLVSWLGNRSKIPVRMARIGDSIDQPGVLLMPCQPSLVLAQNRTFQVDMSASRSLHTPCIDHFFSSLAAHSGRHGVGVLLTGMGSDGAKGLLDLRSAGWYTLAQDESTSVVYGMPQVAKQLGAAHQVLSLDAIGPTISVYLKSPRS